MKKPVFISISLCFVFSLFIFQSPVLGQPPPTLQDGMNQYNADNYEEAIEIFQKIRAADPGSSQAAFFLGLTYKQINDFQHALQPLQDAATIKPPIKEAVVELIDVLYRLDRMEEARKWIDVAEKNNIFPAKTAFLKGMVLAKEGKHAQAIDAFEKSKKLDPSYAQSADLQIGLSYLGDRKFEKAKERFQAAVTLDPLSDLASFARRYQDIVEQRSYLERPLRVTIGIMGQIDTNMLTEPNPNTGYPGSVYSSEEKSLAMMNTFRLDYVPTFSGPWLFNASYALANSIHEKNATTHDVLANTLSVAPGYNFGRFAVNIAANYTHVMKTDSSYKNYSETFSIGPMFRMLLAQNQILEFYAGYAKKSFFNKPLTPEENQSSFGFDSYVSWMWLFENGSIVNFKYGYNVETADGSYWDYGGHRFTANLIYPVWKAVKLQLGGEAYVQDYRNERATLEGIMMKRRDRTYTGMAGLIWDVHRNVSLMAQYNYTRDDSNIGVYDFNREIYSAGMELKF
jgi:tetratricopeptide (TPR) repeat protein